jgi:hypothetical protein
MMQTADKLNYALEYQQRNGTWRYGFLAYTLAEARDIRKIAMRRTGRAVRIVKLPSITNKEV